MHNPRHPKIVMFSLEDNVSMRDWTEDEMEWREIKRHNNHLAKIVSVDIEPTHSRDFHTGYYSIKFNDGFTIDGVSGHNLMMANPECNAPLKFHQEQEKYYTGLYRGDEKVGHTEASQFWKGAAWAHRDSIAHSTNPRRKSPIDWFIARNKWDEMSIGDRKELLDDINKDSAYRGSLPIQSWKYKEFEELPQAIRGAVRYFMSPKKNPRVPEKLLSWRAKQPEGTIMGTDTFQDIYRRAKRQFRDEGYDKYEAHRRAMKVAGKAYWRTAKARYEETHPGKHIKYNPPLEWHKKQHTKLKKELSRLQSRDELNTGVGMFTTGRAYQEQTAIDEEARMKHNPIKSLEENLDEAASKWFLDSETRSYFKQYYIARGFSNDPSYIDEWAERFAKGSAYDRSDLGGQRLLRRIWKGQHFSHNPKRREYWLAKYAKLIKKPTSKFTAIDMERFLSWIERKKKKNPSEDWHLMQMDVADESIRSAPTEELRTYFRGAKDAHDISARASRALKHSRTGIIGNPVDLFDEQTINTLNKWVKWFKSRKIKDPIKIHRKFRKLGLSTVDAGTFTHYVISKLPPSLFGKKKLKGNPKKRLRTEQFWKRVVKMIHELGPIQARETLIGRGYNYDEAQKIMKEALRQIRLGENPPHSVTEIYADIHAIEASKGEDSLWPGENFRHDFKPGAKIYGMPDGSLLIKGKKKLWKNFNYPEKRRG